MPQIAYKREKNEETEATESNMMALIYISFFFLPFDSVPRRNLFLRYVQDRNVKSKKK